MLLNEDISATNYQQLLTLIDPNWQISTLTSTWQTDVRQIIFSVPGLPCQLNDIMQRCDDDDDDDDDDLW